MHSVRIEPTQLIVVGTRTTYQATGVAGILGPHYYTPDRKCVDELLVSGREGRAALPRFARLTYVDKSPGEAN